MVADASDAKLMKALLKKHRPDAFLCANDHTAGVLIQLLFFGVVRVRLYAPKYKNA